MLKIFIIVLFLILQSVSAFAVLSLGTSAKGNSTASVTSVTTNSVTTTAGSTLVGCAVYGGLPPDTHTSFTDSKSNTWTAIGTVWERETNLGYGYVRCFYNIGGTRGTLHTFTETLSVAHLFISVVVAEILGNVEELHVQDRLASLDPATCACTATIVTTKAKAFILSLGTNIGVFVAPWDAPETLINEIRSDDPGTPWTASFAYRVVSVTGSYTGDWSEGASDDYGWIMAFSESVVSGKNLLLLFGGGK
jgi:hypothetical protein